MTSSTQLALDFARVVPASLDQAETAMRILEDWADGDSTDIDEGIARLLAATMHSGPHSALHQFAATGELIADQALAELGDVQVPLEREAWVDALGRYIITGGGHRS
ncbi:hypothetical protein FVP74_11855 [Microbacterium saccharophilum]|uniref:Uncharacterized protein n=1 Tax=Microbacterium saccharophilum TaxID=1213358 RepID=A0A5C8HTG0_9MICO|nr:hypothetical protein [Microbacterium saccharophilum]TXK09197.1 hypothetical protein FVP74_11855 [Microbacterium saccharophilum]GEP47619.1 hypothetical protein MSA03_11270 [Microbacterium saccharophilum]